MARQPPVVLPDGFGETDARHFVASTIALVTALAPVIAGGAAVGGALIQSHGVSSAAKEQAKSTAAALGYEKERDVYARGTEANRYGSMMRQNAPYVAQGSAAAGQMGSLLGLPTPQAASGSMITMRAPDGTTKQVPQSEAQHWTSKGATLVAG